MKKLLGATVGAVLALATPGAFAHTITIGYENAGVGAVNFWYGSYHSQGELPANEGSFNLVGINGNPFLSTTVPFTINVGVKPAGLIDGTTNFIASTYTQGPDGFDDVFTWQGVLFTGLTPGDYQFTYIPIASPTAKWAPWDNSILSSTVSLSGTIVQCGAPGLPACGQPGTSVPEPATLAVLGMGLLGLGAVRRRKTH